MKGEQHFDVLFNPRVRKNLSKIRTSHIAVRFTVSFGKEHLNCMQKAALRAGGRSDVLMKQVLILSGAKGADSGIGRRKIHLQYAGQLSLGLEAGSCCVPISASVSGKIWSKAALWQLLE